MKNSQIKFIMPVFFKGAKHCLQAKAYKYRCYSCQTAVTSVVVNRLFHALGKDYFMLHKILFGSITAHRISSVSNIYAYYVSITYSYCIYAVLFNTYTIH